MIAFKGVEFNPRLYCLVNQQPLILMTGLSVVLERWLYVDERDY